MTSGLKEKLERFTEAERRDALSWLWAESMKGQRMEMIPVDDTLPRPYAIFPLGDARMLRDFFAGQAMCGMLVEIGRQVAAAQSKIIGATVYPASINFEKMAKDAYGFADAMMAEREKDQ